MPRPPHLVELEVLSVRDTVLLKSPQASIHWSVRPACCGNPGRATVTRKADLAIKSFLRQALEEPVARRCCDLSSPQRRLLYDFRLQMCFHCVQALNLTFTATTNSVKVSKLVAVLSTWFLRRCSSPMELQLGAVCGSL